MSKFRKQAFIFFILSVLVLAFSVVPAAAAESDDYDIYLKLDGINGDSTTRGYEKWIKLNDFSFEVENKATVSAGSGSGAGKAAAQPISINKILIPPPFRYFWVQPQVKRLRKVKSFL